MTAEFDEMVREAAIEEDERWNAPEPEIEPLDLTPGHMYPDHNVFECQHTDCRIERIELSLQEIRETMIRTEELVQKTIAAVKPAIDDVLPVIAGLADNPMIGMLFRKKGK